MIHNNKKSISDENTDPYVLSTHCPRNVLLQPTVDPLSLYLSPLVVWSKKFLTGDPGKRMHESEVELLDVTFYHRGKIFSQLWSSFWGSKILTNSTELWDIFTTDPCPISEYRHFCQSGNDRQGVISLSRIRTLLLEIRYSGWTIISFGPIKSILGFIRTPPYYSELNWVQRGSTLSWVEYNGGHGTQLNSTQEVTYSKNLNKT